VLRSRTTREPPARTYDYKVIAEQLQIDAGQMPTLNAQVKTDYDHSANFAFYKTYSWIRVQSDDFLWDSRIKQDVDTQLAAKGWTKVDSNGDAAVSAFRSTQDQQTLQTFYDGFGGGHIVSHRFERKSSDDLDDDEDMDAQARSGRREVAWSRGVTWAQD
jgi:Domain of unknown function (DUF4136)